MRVFLVFAVTACGAEPTNQTAIVSAQPLANRAELRTQALAAMSSDAPLDFARPMEGKPLDRSHTIALFHAACVADDHYSCRMEALLLSQPPEAAYRIVADECKAGDQMSCRALPWDKKSWLFSQAPGAWGRNPECIFADGKTCDLSALRLECDAGYPNSCFALGTREFPPDRALGERSYRLATDGCEQGDVNECVLVDHKTPEVNKRTCDALFDCVELAAYYEQAKRLELQRDALERMCQYGTRAVGGCLSLAEMYANKKLPEPIPGRSDALLRYACPRFYTDRAYTNEHHPLCATVLEK